MLRLFKKKKTVLYTILIGLSIAPFLYNSSYSSFESKSIIQKKELFKAELGYLNSLDKLVYYVDSIYYLNTEINNDTILFVNILSRTVKERFKYGQADYTVSENWIAKLSSLLFWQHLSAIVRAEDILKRNEALCSQQTIVFMEALRKKGIVSRVVGLGYNKGPGHFLCEVMYNKEWHLYDVTLEPKWNKIVNDHKSINYYMQNKDSLYTVYEHCWSKKEFTILTSKFFFGKPNEFPAKKMVLFHKATLLFTYIMPIIFLFLLIFNLLKEKSK